MYEENKSFPECQNKNHKEYKTKIKNIFKFKKWIAILQSNLNNRTILFNENAYVAACVTVKTVQSCYMGQLCHLLL